MKILLTGDIHIGRSSSRLPDDLNTKDFRAASCWERVVELAIEHRVRAVCISGDVADQDNKFFEAYGCLERGIQRLSGHGIQVVAVSGNHDFDTMERLAARLTSDHFRLLGRGGQWERHTISNNGREEIHIDGWSFPGQVVNRSPLETYDLPRDAGLPILGLVHGDLDAPRSQYAPLELARLHALPPSGWLLGHIHAPRLETASNWVLYPGSPQALDPGETGAHGVWLIEVLEGRLGRPQFQPLSTIWYESATVDLMGVETKEQMEAALLENLRRICGEIKTNGGQGLLHANLRLKISGRTKLSEEVAKVLLEFQRSDALRSGSLTVAIEQFDVQTLPLIDLEAHAGSQTALGAVARLILELDSGDHSPALVSLIKNARQEMERIGRIKEFQNIPVREVTQEMAAEALKVQASLLLTQLASQTHE